MSANNHVQCGAVARSEELLRQLSASALPPEGLRPWSRSPAGGERLRDQASVLSAKGARVGRLSAPLPAEGHERRAKGARRATFHETREDKEGEEQQQGQEGLFKANAVREEEEEEAVRSPQLCMPGTRLGQDGAVRKGWLDLRKHSAQTLSPWQSHYMVLESGVLYYQSAGAEDGEHVQVCRLEDCVKVEACNCSTGAKDHYLPRRHGILLQLKGQESMTLAISSQRERDAWLECLLQSHRARCGKSHKPSILLPRIHRSKERGTRQWRPAKFFHVDEGITPSATMRNGLLPAQSLAVLRSGKRDGTTRKVKRGASTHQRASPERENIGFLPCLSVLVQGEAKELGTPADPGTPLAVFNHSKCATPRSANTWHAPRVETASASLVQVFGAAEALDRMADFEMHGGVWGLLNRGSIPTPGVDKSRRKLRTGGDAERLRLDTGKMVATSTAPSRSSSPHSPLVVVDPAGGHRLESAGNVDIVRLGTAAGNVDLVRLGTGHATMATRAVTRRYSRPATQAAREEEEALFEIMVNEFPAGWVKEATCLVGNDVWMMMTAKQQVGIVHAMLADTQSALPLIKTMKTIFETVDNFDLDEQVKRAKCRNQTGITALDSDISINVDSRELQELMTELLCVAVRCNQIQQAVMLLESIPDTDQRKEASELLFELSDEMLSQDLRDLLQSHGFYSTSERRKHARTPSHPSKKESLPEAAKRRLQSRHRRIAKAAAVEAEARRRLGLDEPPMIFAQEYEDDGEEDEHGESLQSRPESEAQFEELIDDISHTLIDDEDAPIVVEEESQKQIASDDNEVNKKEVVEAELHVQIPSFNPEDYLNRPDYGLYNDPTVQEQADEESSDDNNEPLESEFPPDHPVIRIFGSIMGRSKILHFGIWQAWYEARSIERSKVRDQYLNNCQCARVTPAGVQPLHRYMHPTSKTSSALLLSRQSFSKTTIACLLQAMAGVNMDELSFFHADHSGCFPGWVDINALRDKLCDHAMTEIDLSFNDLQCEGACILRDALLDKDSSWKLTSLRLDAVDLRENGCLAIIPLLTVSPSVLALTHLSIAKNAIGDSGMARLIDTLAYNTQLASLNISNNSCSFKTAKALHHMLSANYALKKLDCSYNMIRGQGAVLVAQGLEENSGLTDINLAWNGFGDSEPCDQLAAALKPSSLKVIDLSYNRIGRNQALILASHLEDCPNIRKLVLDGNMVTQAGARMILQATKKAAGEHAEFFADVSMLNCGIGIVDHSAFDPAEPAGDYELDLKDKYSRNILMSLFRIVAQDRGLFVPLETSEALIGSTEEFRSASPGSKQSITDVVEDVKSHATQDEEEVMNAMYAEEVEPIKASKSNKNTGGEKAGKKGKKNKKTQKKGKKKDHIIIPPLVFFPYRLQLPKYKLPDGSMIVNPNESDWYVPHNGTIRFKFGSLSVGAKDDLDAISLNKIMTVFTDVEKTHAQRMDAFDLHFGSQTAIRIDQAKKLLEALPEDGHDRLREKELVLTRSAVVVRCFHRLVETDQGRDLMDVLDDHSKALASKSLGAASFSFTPNNATGHYRLNLEDPQDRELCMRLVNCYNEQRIRLKQLEKDCMLRRQDIVSDKVERVWRNFKINSKPTEFSPSFRVPHTGRLQVDFVVVNKPAPASTPMSTNQFREWCSDELDPLVHEQEKLVNAVRLKSNTCFFCCEQVARLLRKLTLPVLRVEMCIIAFARTIDWHNFKYILDSMTVGEASSLQSRLGLINLWDESMAVGYYDLDLSLSEHRWVCLELLLLVYEEAGGKLTDTSYEMVDFEVPSAWIRDMPKRGVFQCYYTRDCDAVLAAASEGAHSDRRSPYRWDESQQASFCQQTFSMFIPRWIQAHIHEAGAEGIDVFYEPPGHGWVNEHKLKRIQARLYEAFGSVQSAMERLDQDLSGTVEVHELVEALRGLKIWLNANQLSALLEALDPDASGTISMEELRHFWHKYASDWQLSQDSHYSALRRQEEHFISHDRHGPLKKHETKFKVGASNEAFKRMDKMSLGDLVRDADAASQEETVQEPL